MTNHSKPTDPKFAKLLAKIVAETPSARAPEANDLPEGEEYTYNDFVDLIEANYHEVWVAASTDMVRTHQLLIDFEIKNTQDKAEIKEWLCRREPKMVDGSPKLSLKDVLDVYEHQWANRNGLFGETDYDRKIYPSEAEKFSEMTDRLFESVWNGSKPVKLIIHIRDTLYNPNSQHTILTGQHSAKEVTDALVELAHDCRAKLKGPNRGI